MNPFMSPVCYHRANIHCEMLAVIYIIRHQEHIISIVRKCIAILTWMILMVILAWYMYNMVYFLLQL
jgi:hypothetical protein